MRYVIGTSLMIMISIISFVHEIQGQLDDFPAQQAQEKPEEEREVLLGKEKEALIALAIVGLVTAVLNREQVVKAISQSSISLARISEMLRSAGSKILTFLQGSVARLSNQVAQLRTARSLAGIGQTVTEVGKLAEAKGLSASYWIAKGARGIKPIGISQVELGNIAESADIIGQTTRQAVTGIQNLRNMAQAARGVIEGAVRSAFGTLEKTSGTLLKGLNKAFTGAAQRANWSLAYKVYETKENILKGILDGIQRSIEQGATMTPGGIKEFVTKSVREKLEDPMVLEVLQDAMSHGLID